VKEKKPKVLRNPKNENTGYNIFDDKNIESLMRYYKISNPDVLFEYIKKHRLTKKIDDKPLEQNSA
jgi:Mor family transcriptional regulator